MWKAATICPALQVDLLTLKVVSEVTCDVGYLCANLVFLGLSVLDLGPMYATDKRQMDRCQTRIIA